MRYKRNFDEMVRTLRRQVSINYRLFVRKDHHSTYDPRHKLAPIATVTYFVTKVYDKICVILRYDDVTERITLDRVVLAPQSEDHNFRSSQATKRPQTVKDLIRRSRQGNGISIDDELDLPGLMTRSRSKAKESRNHSTESSRHEPATEPGKKPSTPQTEQWTMSRILMALTYIQ